MIYERAATDIDKDSKGRQFVYSPSPMRPKDYSPRIDDLRNRPL